MKNVLQMFTRYFTVFSLCINFCLSLDEFPEVNTPLGRVSGLWKTSKNGRKYAAFEGLPYAQPPIGDLRFEESQPITPWPGTWVADAPHTCLQITVYSMELEGNEDCLYLNVYVPAKFLNNPKKLEVIFSIHGGSFLVGSGHNETEASHFIDRDIVLVSINYRVGILGFLSTEDEVIPGNNGLKDQVLALKWVRDNIASFGGNPDSITIIGLSAGGVSVHFHYLSPLSRGLFHRGIAQSGTALAPWAIRRNPLKHAKKLGELVGCPDTSTEELKSCLKRRPAQHLLKKLHHFFEYNYLPLSPFAPAIEKPSERAFLDKEPYWILKKGNITDVPLIISTVTDDGLLPSAILWPHLDEVDKKWTEVLCHLMDCRETLPESKWEIVGKQILNHYLGVGEKINKKNFKKFTQIFTDRLFAFPAEVTAKLQAGVTKSPVYYYFFNYQGGENNILHLYARPEDVKDLTGVGHGEDYIYCYGVYQVVPLSKQDELLRNDCQDMYYTFATTGIPSFDGTKIWQPTGSEELVYLNITGPDNIKLEKRKDFASVNFWNSLGLLEYENAIGKDES